MLQIQEKQVQDVTVLELVGRVTIGRSCQELEWRLDELSNAGKRTVVIDLSGVTFIDSSGLGIFAMCSGKLRSVGGELRIAAPITPVEQVFRLTKVDMIVPIYATTAEALAAASGRAASA